LQHPILPPKGRIFGKLCYSTNLYLSLSEEEEEEEELSASSSKSNS